MLRLRTLGECAIETDVSRIGPDADVLFATGLYLAIERGRRVARAELLELIWPAVDGRQGRHCLRQALYRLRQSGAVLESTTMHVMIPESDVELDFAVFLSSGASDRARPDEDRCREFLPGYVPDFSEPFSEWVEEQRAFVHGQIRRVLVARLGELRTRGDWSRVEGVARACLRFDAFNEEATLARAEAAAMTGSKREAVEILDRYLAELGPGAGEIRLPASVLKKRISERLTSLGFQLSAETPFFGRTLEMVTLGERISRARAGSGGALAILGEQGIGKTRLLEEATAVAALDGVRIQRFACHEYDSTRPLSMFVDLVPLLRALPGSLGCSPESLRYLNRLTGVDRSIGEATDSDGGIDYAARIRLALFDLLAAVSEDRCVVVVVEDVQWLDPQSLSLLSEMITWSATQPLLFILTARKHTSLAAEPIWTHCDRHELSPLPNESARMLVESLTVSQRREVDDAFVTWCTQVAEGSPFFLRELTLHWLATGVTRVPSTVQAVLDVRLSGMADSALRMLQAIAVLAGLSTVPRLRHLLGYTPHELVTGLAQLEERGLVKSVETGVQCRHQLVSDAAIRNLPVAATRFLHRAAAELLEDEMRTSPSATLLWACARHWRDAHEDSEAVRVTLSCARHLVEIGMLDDALAILKTAEEIRLTDSQRAEIERLKLRIFQLGSRWISALEVTDRLKILNADSVLALSAKDGHTDEEIVLLEASWFANNDVNELLPKLLMCVTSGAASDRHKLLAAGTAIIVADHACDEQAAGTIYAATAAMGSLTPEQQLAQKRVHLIYHTSYGSLGRATEVASELLRLHRDCGNPAMLGRVLGWASFPCRRIGAFATAREHLAEGVLLSKRFGLCELELNLCINLANLCFESCDLSEIDYWVGESRRLAEHSTVPSVHVALEILNACMALHGGDGLAAERSIEAALSFHGPIHHDARFEGNILSNQLEVALLRGDLETIAILVPRGREVHIQLRAFGDQDLLSLAVAKGLRALGREGDARNLLDQYFASYRREWSPLPFQWTQSPFTDITCEARNGAGKTPVA